MNTTKETQEMYLKVIYELIRRKGSVRSADVAAGSAGMPVPRYRMQ